MAVGFPSLQTISVAVGLVFLAAKGITIIFHTPPPDTVWGKLYRAIEAVALVIGRAKETGLIQPAPAAYERQFTQAAEFLKSLENQK